MVITELKLKNFKRFRDTTITLGPGLSILLGDNETGKTTLLEALLAVLFASPKSRAKGVDEWITWGAPERPRVSLLYVVDGSEFRLEKDFEAGTVSLVNTATGETLADEKRVSAAVSGHLGIGSRDLFLGTVCVRHDELSALSTGMREVRDRMQQVMTGGQDVSALGVVKALREKIAEINRGMDRPATRPGIRRTLEDRIEAARRKSHDLREQAERYRAAGVSMAAIDSEAVELQSVLDSKKTLVEKSRRCREVRGRLDAMSGDFRVIETRLNRIREIEEERARAASRTENLARFAAAPEALAEIARIDGVIEEFHRAEDLEKARLDATPKKGSASRVAAVGIGVALLLAGGWFGYSTDPLFYIAALVGALVAGYGAAGPRARADTEIQRIVEMRAGDMRARAEAAESERRRIVERYGVTSSAELQEGHRLYQEAASGHDRFDSEIQGLLAGGTREALVEARSELVRKMALEERALSETPEFGDLSPQEIHALTEEAEKMEARLKALSASRMQEQLVLQSSRNAADEAMLAEEELSGALDALRSVEHRLGVYEKAAGVMEEALRSTLTTARDVLGRELSGHIARITGGRYDCVSVSDEDLGLTLLSTERGGALCAGEPSKGTTDQLYLSARLALAQLLYGDRKPPLILDDPLSNFDDLRLANAMTVLEDFASERQIILFTCHDRYSVFGGNVLRL